MKKSIVYILIGPPCSGKSTWSRKFLKENSNYIRINRDELRKMFKGRFILDKDLEKFINKITKNIILEASNNNKDIIIDNTNCKAYTIESLIFDNSQCIFRAKFFPVPLWKLRIRNIFRYIRTGFWIPPKVLNDMHNNYNFLYNDFHKLLGKYIHKIEKIEI